MSASDVIDRRQRPLDVLGTPKRPLIMASAFWLGLWDEGRKVAFGGFEEVLRPVNDDENEGLLRGTCPLEDKLHAAVASIRLPMEWCDRWTESIGNWRGFIDGEPRADVVDLIEGAHPMPSTFTEAMDEYSYWAWRTYMSAMCVAYNGETPAAVLADPNPGDLSLDLTVVVRLELIKPLVLHRLRARTIAEVETRLRIYGHLGEKEPQVLAAVLRDLEIIRKEEASGGDGRRGPGLTKARQPRHVSTVSTGFDHLDRTNLARKARRRDAVTRSPELGFGSNNGTIVQPVAYQPLVLEAVEPPPTPSFTNRMKRRVSRGRTRQQASLGDQIDWVDIVTGAARA